MQRRENKISHSDVYVYPFCVCSKQRQVYFSSLTKSEKSRSEEYGLIFSQLKKTKCISRSVVNDVVVHISMAICLFLIKMFFLRTK